jgi:phosphoglycerate kinase
MKFPSLKDLSATLLRGNPIGTLRGKKVLLRLDLNVAFKDGRVADDFRIKKSFQTLAYLKEQGAKIIIIAHLENAEVNSLEFVYTYLKNYFPLSFSGEVLGAKTDALIAEMQEGEMVLLENLRQNPGEKNNDEQFAKSLASLGEIYVNEAFSASHRRHASIVGVTKFLPSYAGFRFVEEIEKLSLSFHPPKPFLFILGGAKFDTKLPLIKKFLPLADFVYVAGALATDCYKAQGLTIGKSFSSNGNFDLSEIIKNPKIYLPSDVVVKNGDLISTKIPSEVEDNDNMLDAGPQSLEDLRKLIEQAKFILWNGPLGNYEIGFKSATLELARMLADSSSLSQATSIVGGGDTLATIAELHNEDKFSFVSTGGGAMLDFLANETLPAIEALESGAKLPTGARLQAGA